LGRFGQSIAVMGKRMDYTNEIVKIKISRIDDLVLTEIKTLFGTAPIEFVAEILNYSQSGSRLFIVVPFFEFTFNNYKHNIKLKRNGLKMQDVLEKWMFYNQLTLAIEYLHEKGIGK
jgi:hypothetical protein